MKEFITLILLTVAVAFQSVAQESNSSSTTRTVGFEVHKKDNNGTSKVHRAPVCIDVEAYYNEESQILDICHDGEAAGEVFLSLNGNVIDYSSVINASFRISVPGLYKIEIIGETWIAVGYLQL